MPGPTMLPSGQSLQMLPPPPPPPPAALPPEAGGALSWLEAGLGALLALGLLLALLRQLWALRWSLSRDPGSPLPLPQGSMGWPFFGETFHWLIQGSAFHSSRRLRYGPVFKTHLLGKPVIRVSGAENVRKILLGEHSLVSAQWPTSTHILLGTHTLLGAKAQAHRHRRKVLSRVFSRAALASYLPGLQAEVRRALRGWCRGSKRGPVEVYSAAKSLTFRLAARVLLGLRLEEQRFQELSGAFQQLVENLFCLPLDLPFCGLRKGIKARDLLHSYMEKAILEKLQRKDPEAHSDALDFIIHSAKEHGKEFTMQELKESAIELIFAAFFTTASASTSMILLLLQHPLVVKKIEQELTSHDLTKECHCFIAEESLANSQSCQETLGVHGKENKDWDSKNPLPLRLEGEESKETEEKNNSCSAAKVAQETMHGTTNCLRSVPRQEEASQLYSNLEGPECYCQPYLTLEKLSRLHYLDCVIKEVLRLLPPVSGGYRTALQTFELDGYQIPKGWSVMYSIRDTHETASIYQSPPDTFDPERFWISQEEREEPKGVGALRFHYIPFGGGVRHCIGKELAQVILKMLAIELVSTARWELATADFPKMQTVPIVHPVDGLHLYFLPLKPGRESSGASKANT